MNRAKNTAKKWQEDEALRRFKLISPLLQEWLDEARKLQIREQIATENGISIRTLYRYEKAWREDEFQGLNPATGKNTSDRICLITSRSYCSRPSS